MTDSRTPRSADSREKAQRTKQWINPRQLLDPDPKEGMVFRWIRAEFLGNSDAKNLSSKKREGWEPVPPTEVPEFRDFHNSKTGLIEYGGLILCWMEQELVDQRNAYYRQRANDQITAVDNNLMRESDPRMPMGKPERHTSQTFGKGSAGS